ncbi:metastasis-associated in colon cancer protein 1 isoform X2 [Protopterus annectens]|nr:metastasis-associated in colon cancer protein 1 isoform X2 [Protopterus annectens]XP_043920646.1 metastasis-associated in colon cancer protein 1 isoform X2 [Protopterus annectens]XP_043920647.1 metastasis-associated in colon cancer protein 1 isoform X2 [Protopterus annectens]XP_043920648.1 metastasis-associated in colon cancer protein 1 isoform X2 [Protopterus annectens]XP_043920649.1 metastasis-associated in colon cancer protein 1 isoform X2 [Protopterus annectens]
MAATKKTSFRQGTIQRSKSEGNLIDLDDEGPMANSFYKDDVFFQKNAQANTVNIFGNMPDVLQPTVQSNSKNINPFWNNLSKSNPFLIDISQTDDSTNISRISLAKEDNFLFGDYREIADSVASSTDELDIDLLLKNTSSRRSGKSKSASDILDILDNKETPLQKKDTASQVFSADLEWLQNDREAYKSAWLSHRQLTRSCLDLDVISQSPGWAQTQAAETNIICKVDHQGGSVELPDSDIKVYIPEGHIAPGETQEVTLKAILDPPHLLNNRHSTTISPLLEIQLSKPQVKNAILAEMKVCAEVKRDPLSQVLAEIVCLTSTRKEGPFLRVNDCYIYGDTLQVKLNSLNSIMYVIAVAQLRNTDPSSSFVWDYISKSITMALYGPKHIHPSFNAVCAIFGHNHTPQKLTVTNLMKGKKTLPPVVFQLWGRQQFLLQKTQELVISGHTRDSKFEMHTVCQLSEEQLIMGKVVQLQFPFSVQGVEEIKPFAFKMYVQGHGGELVTELDIQSPTGTPRKLGASDRQKRIQKRREVKSAPLPILFTLRYPEFQDKSVEILNYAVTQKSVLRQPKIDYLLEYFKGDTIALLDTNKVKVIGHARIKEWYIGFLRGKIGLVHCKNVKVISQHQVMNFSDVSMTTSIFLEQLVKPLRRLTYIYSSVLAIVCEKIHDWKGFAEALGYSNLSLEDISRSQVEKESERVTCVVEKLKEDCHSSTANKKFLQELIRGLLKINCQGTVAQITQDVIVLSTAVQLGVHWRELAEKLAGLTKQQIKEYEVPHRIRKQELNSETMWKPAYDFLYTWSANYGEGYRDVLQDLHVALDKMRNPITRQWRHLTGTLILVSCMEKLGAAAFPKMDDR